jgi:flagellar protein FlbD
MRVSETGDCADIEMEGTTMIELTRLNGQKLFVNCDLLKFAEASPDTVLTLLTGDKIVVRESCEDVIALAVNFRARVLAAAWPDGVSVNAALLAQCIAPEAKSSQA